jgi:uncharacterized repeat protein (TIGR03803 family)
MKNARLLSTRRVTLALIGLSLGLCAQAQTQPPARPGAQGSAEKVIHTFNPAPHGYYPLGTVVADQLGNLYGTTRFGGSYDAGVLYKATQNSQGKWTQTVLYNFPGGSGAYAPNQVVFDSAGNLYGFSYFGGTAGYGTAVKLTPNSQGAWSATVLYDFPGTGLETYLDGNLILIDPSGNLYGVLGGANRSSIFQLSPSSNGTWTKTMVYDFISPTDGDYIGGMFIDAHGNLYGTTETGGTAGCKCGTVFELSPSSGTWTHTILYSFAGAGGTDGSPLNVTMDSNGNLFGATAYGQQAGNCRSEGDGCGAVFELQPGANGQWTETILYDFESKGVMVYPSALVIDSHQNLYGTGFYGGGKSQTCYQGCGFVFEISPSGNGQWTETDLYDFKGGSDGYQPPFGFGLAWSGGNLYGTTSLGGATNLSGTIFRLTPQGSSWQLNTIYTFPFLDGNAPSTGLVGDGNGNLFGTAAGGAYDEGSVFEMSPASGGGWTESLIYSFNGYSAGQSVGPSALVADPYGNFYGTTQVGGAGNYGTVFELSPSSSKGWTSTTLYSFTGAADGSTPEAGVVLDASGNLFGTTYTGGSKNLSKNHGGTIFELSRESNGQWKKNVRYNFAGAPFDGELPAASMIMDKAGNFYGTTSSGGSSTNCSGGCGTVFELSPSAGSWKETVLYSFQGGTRDGSDPRTSLIFDDAGNLYGTTFEGGVANCYIDGAPSCGVVFKLSPTGTGAWKETVLHTFTHSTTDGVNPTSGLVFDAAGNLYGTTAGGGTYSHGTIFKLAPSGGSWVYSVAYNFENSPDGNYPAGNLWLDPSGNFYGITEAGGNAINLSSNGYGTVYEFTP